MSSQNVYIMRCLPWAALLSGCGHAKWLLGHSWVRSTLVVVVVGVVPVVSVVVLLRVNVSSEGGLCSVTSD